MRKDVRELGYLTWKDRFIDDAFPYAYLKISDGCDRGCTYCAIPAMRGRYRSRPLDSILNESEFLTANGKKELILVSQEATMWGWDLPNQPSIVDLLKELEAVDKVAWIRLMYLYPSQVNNELIDYMTAGHKTLPYFDLPLQHINADILERMRRPMNPPKTHKLLSRIRQQPGLATIRTTFIVGFPGETDSQFEELLDFVAEQRFDRLGVFPYSAEEGTPAERMPDQAPEDVKVERVDRIMSLQQEIAFERNNSLIGKWVDVIIDSVEDDGAGIGRTGADCPDIDQDVFVTGSSAAVGDICRVHITGVVGYDLTGTKVEESDT